jgi:hypothetical protein
MGAPKDVHEVERIATEVLYTVHRDPAAKLSSSSFEADVERAITQFGRSYVGVRAETRASGVKSSNCAVALLVSGGFGLDHLETIWSRQLAEFGLSATRAHADAEAP